MRPGEDELKTRIFTSGILKRGEKLLIMRRRPDDERNPGRWDCVGGHFLEEESAEDCMLREAKEETGLDVKITKAGRVFEFVDRYGRAVGLPFLLRCDTGSVKLTEHTDYRWVTPRELGGFDCVPEIKKALASLGLSRNRS